MTRACSKCKKEKSIESFSRDSQRLDGICPSCKDCRNLRNKIFYTKNKNEIRDRQKSYYLVNPDLALEKYKRYRIKNKKVIHGKMASRIRKNPNLRLRMNVSRAIRHSLRKEGNRSFAILGYSSEDLKQHLESQFEPWMNWDNYGGSASQKEKTWHIDHVTPQSSFNFDSIGHPEFKKCWALSNLRPLEKIDNIKKGNKILEEPEIKCISMSPILT